jgi:hypothetical protein
LRTGTSSSGRRDGRKPPTSTSRTCSGFDGRAEFGTAHWKLDAITEYAADRPLAWVDDSLTEDCHAWASERQAPTLLVQTQSDVGLRDEHVDELLAWADELTAVSERRST